LIGFLAHAINREERRAYLIGAARRHNKVMLVRSFSCAAEHVLELIKMKNFLCQRDGCSIGRDVYVYMINEPR
jgi:hypothetical protein